MIIAISARPKIPRFRVAIAVRTFETILAIHTTAMPREGATITFPKPLVKPSGTFRTTCQVVSQLLVKMDMAKTA